MPARLRGVWRLRYPALGVLPALLFLLYGLAAAVSRGAQIALLAAGLDGRTVKGEAAAGESASSLTPASSWWFWSSVWGVCGCSGPGERSGVHCRTVDGDSAGCAAGEDGPVDEAVWEAQGNEGEARRDDGAGEGEGEPERPSAGGGVFSREGEAALRVELWRLKGLTRSR